MPAFRRTSVIVRGSAWATVVAAILWAIGRAACAESTSVFDTVSPPAKAIAELFYLVLAIAAVIFLLVGGMLLYCIVRFRRRGSEDSEPPQLYGSQPIEVAWTVGPLLTVLVLLMVVVRTVAETRHRDVSPDALHVRVVGHRWWWEFQYPNRGITTANELHVPAGTEGRDRPVVLDLESADVAHSFWVPRLSGKTDLIPGRQNTMWFQTSQVGVYFGQCAEYCGVQHANMLIRVVVEPPEGFDSWAEGQRRPAAEEPRFAAGREVLLKRTCVNCHTIRGTAAAGTVGPDLTHLASRHTLAAGVIPNTPEQLAAWLRDPQAIKPGCNMPTLGLSPDEIQQLVAYLGSLR